MRSVPASIAASNTWRDPSTLISCARSPSPMMAKARWTTTSASLTASRTLFLSRTSPWRYSVLRQPSDAGSNGRRARPTIRFTRRERSSASTTARPRSPVGPVTATVRPVLATRAFISKRPRQSREDAQASLGGGEALSREKHRSEGRGLGWRARCAASAVALLVAGLAAAPATNAARIPARPIPEGETNAPGFVGAPARPNPLFAPAPPRHPFMAPNARSNIHNDAYASDVYFAQGGPLGHGMQRRSTLQFADCGSLAFDSRDRVVTICVGLVRPRLMLFDPKTLDTLASFELPPRDPSSGDPFSGFSGGRYFYLDERDRVVTSTPNRQVWVIGQRSTRMGPAFARERVYDLSRTVPPGDQIVSVLPDFDGRLWFVSAKGLVGTIARGSGAVRVRRLAGEEIGNSFSVDETGAVYIVSDAAMYRFDASPPGAPRVTWREVYDNDGVQKPSQVTAGSGTIPTAMRRDLVAIMDNDDPEKVTVYRRAKRVSGSRLVCTEPVFEPGASATENSLIGTSRSLIAENNYGYTGPAATQMGRSTAPGLTRGDDPWYFTALDFRTGRTVYKRLAGEGFGYNNNYAPISIGPDSSAYVGVLGGLVRLFDTRSGAPAGGAVPGDCGGRRATLTGTSGNDRLEGTAGRDVISVGAGDDAVEGGGGPDVICGGSGNDRLAARPGTTISTA